MVFNRPQWEDSDARRAETLLRQRLDPMPSCEWFNPAATHGRKRYVIELRRPCEPEEIDPADLERWYFERSFVFRRVFALVLDAPANEIDDPLGP